MGGPLDFLPLLYPEPFEFLYTPNTKYVEFRQKTVSFFVAVSFSGVFGIADIETCDASPKPLSFGAILHALISLTAGTCVLGWLHDIQKNGQTINFLLRVCRCILEVIQLLLAPKPMYSRTNTHTHRHTYARAHTPYACVAVENFGREECVCVCMYGDIFSDFKYESILKAGIARWVAYTLYTHTHTHTHVYVFIYRAVCFWHFAPILFGTWQNRGKMWESVIFFGDQNILWVCVWGYYRTTDTNTDLFKRLYTTCNALLHFLFLAICAYTFWYILCWNVWPQSTQIIFFLFLTPEQMCRGVVGQSVHVPAYWNASSLHLSA